MPAPGQSADAKGSGSRLAYKEGSHLAKLAAPPARPVFIQKAELEVMRKALADLAGEHDSFQVRYRVIEAMAASPACGLKWWPPTDDMLAIIERSFRATLRGEPNLPQAKAAASVGPGTPATTRAHMLKSNVTTHSLSRVEGSAPKSGGTPLDMDLACALYQELMRHQEEQTSKFDAVIAKREEQRKLDEENSRIRKEAAEQARLKRSKELEEQEQAALRRGGRAGRAQLVAIRAEKAAAAKEAVALEEENAKMAGKSAMSMFEKAWPGGTLTSTKLDASFQDLPDQPSGAQSRYFFEKRRRYCDLSVETDYLTTEGFYRLVRDLRHLQADLAAEKMVALQKVFKKMDTRRRGEISLADFVAQIETQEAHLLMPVVDALLKTSDANSNGLLDSDEFPGFYLGWLELHRIFEVFDDCRLEEKWANREHLQGQLSFTDIELLSSVFLGIKAKSVHGRQVALYDPVVASLDLTTANPTRDEIDAALADFVKTDAFDVFDFIELHRKLRSMRTNPELVTMYRQARDLHGLNDMESIANHHHRLNTHQSMLRTPSQTSGSIALNRGSRPPEARTLSAGSNLAKTAEHLKALKETADAQREETELLSMLLRRKEMLSRASTLIMEAILKNPVGINSPLRAQNRACTSSSFKIETVPLTQDRSDRDMQELVKFFRNSPDLKDMPHETLMSLTRCGSAVFSRSKSSICDFKDWGSGYWIIIVGVANVYMRGPSGKQVKVSEMRAGQGFGEMFLLFGEFLPRRFRVEASTDGVLAAFVEKDDYFAIGLDQYHRSTTWESLSKKHNLLRNMPGFNHLEPVDKFHVCYQLREQHGLARAELYNADTDYVDTPKMDLLLRDQAVLQEKPDKYLLIVQSGSCDVWVNAPVEDVEVPDSHERALNEHTRFQMVPGSKRLCRVSNLAAGAIFGSFATGPAVRKITASETSSVTVYAIRPEEALTRLRREGVQKIFQERNSREAFVESTLQESLEKDVGNFIKGERDLKQLGTMLSIASNPKKNVQPEVSSDFSRRSADEVGAMGSVYNVTSQYSAGNLSAKIPRAVESSGGMKPSRCHIQNQFKHISADFNVSSVIGRFKRPLSKDKSHLSIRGAPPTVPGFSKEPSWLDNMAYKVAIRVNDPKNTRQTEAQQKLVEAFLLYESWQNAGKSVDLHRFLDLVKTSHLVGNPSDPRDNLLTSITMDDAIEVFKQVQNAELPTASLLRGGRKSTGPSFILTRFTFSQCMNLIAMRLRISMPKVYNFPVEAAAVVPISNKATRVSLSGSEQNMDTVCASRAKGSLHRSHQEQIDISQSGRPGSSAYRESITRRPATSCGFVRATGMRENTSDGIGRDMKRAERPHSSLNKIMPTRPGSACLVDMIVSSAPSAAMASRSNSPVDRSERKNSPARSTYDLEITKTSAIDRIYSMPDTFGVLSHIDHQRKMRTRIVKRALKKIRLPAGLQVSNDRPAQKSKTYQMLQHQLYGTEQPQNSLHWISTSVLDDQLHEPPPIALHQHLHSTPVFLTSLSNPAVVASHLEPGVEQDPPGGSHEQTPAASEQAANTMSLSRGPQIRLGRTHSGESSTVLYADDL